jgi:hypothetical protein
MRERFGTVRWLSFFLYFVGLVFVFVTKNARVEPLFNLAGSFLLCFDSFALPPQQTYSLLGAHEEAKPKFRPSTLWGLGFTSLVAGLIYHSQIRVSAVLMMSGMCFLAFDRYAKSRSISASK